MCVSSISSSDRGGNGIGLSRGPLRIFEGYSSLSERGEECGARKLEPENEERVTKEAGEEV